jgi:hypothetical protein
MKTLVVGWFSFEHMGATAGDLMARDLACEWLAEAGHDVEYAVVPPFSGGVDWRRVDPGDYSCVVFVCGPFGNGEPLTEFFSRFAGIPLVGLDVSMLEPLESWNPFQSLWERDSSRTARPDISILSRQPLVPVVGTVLIGGQGEYGDRARQTSANDAIRRLLDSREVAVVPIDTCLDPENTTGLRTPAEIESLIARMDVVVTTRLHGTVLALKNGVPAVVIDSVSGGHKVIRQARTIGWPVAFVIDELTDQKLRDAFDYCLTAEARQQAKECCRRAKGAVEKVRAEFIAELQQLVETAGERM